MPMTADQMIKYLKQNGFEYDHSKGSHRIYKNKTTKRMAVVPYHRKDLPSGTEKSILRQAGLL